MSDHVNSIQKHKLRFGIASLLLLTTLVALVIRLADSHAVVEISFLDLEFDSTNGPNSGGSSIPRRIERLHNRRVRIRGYISPQSVFREKGNKSFVLARDHNEPETKDCDFIIIRMLDEAGVDFTTRPITLTGKFSILSPPLTTGNHMLLYEIDEANLEP